MFGLGSMWKGAKYAAACAVACIAWRYIDRCCTRCCEKGDDWSIEAECAMGEIAAGYLRKKGKGADIWSKRYIVLVKGKLIYYLDQMRDNQKGEIVIAGATAGPSPSRGDEEKKFYFEISHPVCGTREFYAKSDMRRRQWINKINTLATELMLMSHWGTLKKKGGLIAEVWQPRWCCCNSESLDYFDAATDSKSKGSIDIRAAILKPSAHEHYPYCIEIEQRAPSKGRFGQNKTGKVYYFAAESQHERDKWISMLRSSASRFDEKNLGEDGEVTNPLGGGEDKHGDGADWLAGMMGEDGASPTRSKGNRGPSRGMESYLDKKSKSLLTRRHWYRRYFRLDKDKRALVYYAKREGDTDTLGGGIVGPTPLSPERTAGAAAGAAGGGKDSGGGGGGGGGGAFARLKALQEEGHDGVDGEGEKDGGAGKDTTPSPSPAIGMPASNSSSSGAAVSIMGGGGGADDDIPKADGADKEKERGSILISSIRGNVSRKEGTGFTFEVGTGRIYHLRADTAEERDMWIDVLEEWIEFYSV